LRVATRLVSGQVDVHVEWCQVSLSAMQRVAKISDRMQQQHAIYPTIPKYSRREIFLGYASPCLMDLLTRNSGAHVRIIAGPTVFAIHWRYRQTLWLFETCFQPHSAFLYCPYSTVCTILKVLTMKCCSEHLIYASALLSSLAVYYFYLYIYPLSSQPSAISQASHLLSIPV
jgi:hypothetical protein